VSFIIVTIDQIAES